MLVCLLSSINRPSSLLFFLVQICCHTQKSKCIALLLFFVLLWSALTKECIFDHKRKISCSDLLELTIFMSSQSASNLQAFIFVTSFSGQAMSQWRERSQVVHWRNKLKNVVSSLFSLIELGLLSPVQIQNLDYSESFRFRIVFLKLGVRTLFCKYCLTGLGYVVTKDMVATSTIHVNDPSLVRT